MRNIDPRDNKQQLMMPCLCTTCLNHIEHKVEEVQFYLFKYEIDLSYTKWDKHGEKDEQATTAQIPVNATIEFVDDMDFDMDFGSKIPTYSPATVEMVNPTKESFDEDDLAMFQELLLDAKKPLYKGCPDFTKLSAIMLPAGNEMVEKTYQAKKLMRMMRSGYKKIHVCSNNYILYWKDNKELTICPICGISRWKVDNKTHKVYKNIPAKAWRTIDEKFPKIAKDLRSLRLGISTDGVNVNSGTRHHRVDTYDASTKENFNLCAVMLWTINDYPALGTLCGCPYSGFKEKNVCESLVRTLLNISRKTKDGMNARLDLAELRIKPELFARQEEDKTALPPAGHVQNKNRPDGCIAQETIAKETIEFFSEYHITMKTIGIPPDKHVTNENEDGKPLSIDKSSEVSGEVFQKAHLYVIQNTDEIVPHIERYKQVLKTKNPGKRIALLENKHSKSFAKWLREEVIYTCNEIQVERELAISKDSVSETVRWISYGPRTTIMKYEAYNINGYTFCTKSNDGIVYQNSGVSVEAVDLHISKEVATTRKHFIMGFYKIYGY
nr:hypothetical protein [Tanacetum cinerariifolium]